MSQNNADLINRIKRSKYAPLYNHLKNQKGTVWQPTLKEIERILGFSLPDTANKRPEWWGNENEPTTHVQCRAWMLADWRTNDPNPTMGRITFARLP